MSEIHIINKLYKDRRRKIGDALTMFRQGLAKPKAIDLILKADDIATTEMIQEQSEEIDRLTHRIAELEEKLKSSNTQIRGFAYDYCNTCGKEYFRGFNDSVHCDECEPKSINRLG